MGRVKLTTSSLDSKGIETRDVFVPFSKKNINPHIKIEPPLPGVIVYRFEESYLYPNCSLVNDALVDYVKENQRRGKDMSNISASDRPWNDPGPRRNASTSEQEENMKKPDLHAIVLDFSQVYVSSPSGAITKMNHSVYRSHIDTTAVQSLIDTRTEVERWADHPVEFHFATILSPWIRRALIAGGFGLGVSSRVPDLVPVVPYGEDTPNFISTQDANSSCDLESGSVKKSHHESQLYPGSEPIISEDTPFFHIDLVSAVRAAEDGIEIGRSISSD
ncbi:hypothetical protein C0993_010527 [Termitomyces sp. T159_Od127]|nr:hypothetical protein C0993_010527 [Termitomyces sp. T159_Od127]